MSVDYSPKPFPSTHHAFLKARAGDFVIVQEPGSCNQDWWLGQVVFCEGGARDPSVNSLFQVADVDNGAIRWVNADCVSDILRSLDGLELRA